MGSVLKIGPRPCFLIDSSGNNAAHFDIFFEIKENSDGAFTGPGLEFSGETIIIESGEEQRIQVYASDQIQLIGRLMRLTYAYFQGSCRGTDLRLATLGVADVFTESDLFR